MVFTLVGISAGYYRVLKIRNILYIFPQRPVENRTGRAARKAVPDCQEFHLSHVKDILTNNSPEEWERIVNRMVKLAAQQITPGEARQIIYFLATEYGPRSGEFVRRPASPAR
jgi:hypothetical protein